MRSFARRLTWVVRSSIQPTPMATDTMNNWSAGQWPTGETKPLSQQNSVSLNAKAGEVDLSPETLAEISRIAAPGLAQGANVAINP